MEPDINLKLRNIIREGLFDFLKKDKNTTSEKSQEGYLGDMPRDIAYDIFSKNMSQDLKKIVADVVKSIDNPFVSQSLRRWVYNSINGKDFIKMGHKIPALALSKEQGEYIISNMDNLIAIHQKQKNELNNSVKDFIKAFPTN